MYSSIESRNPRNAKGQRSDVDGPRLLQRFVEDAEAPDRRALPREALRPVVLQGPLGLQRVLLEAIADDVEAWLPADTSC